MKSNFAFVLAASLVLSCSSAFAISPCRQAIIDHDAIVSQQKDVLLDAFNAEENLLGGAFGAHRGAGAVYREREDKLKILAIRAAASKEFNALGEKLKTQKVIIKIRCES